VEWVCGHSGELGNQMADEIATGAVEQDTPPWQADLSTHTTSLSQHLATNSNWSQVYDNFSNNRRPFAIIRHGQHRNGRSVPLAPWRIWSGVQHYQSSTTKGQSTPSSAAAGTQLATLSISKGYIEYFRHLQSCRHDILTCIQTITTVYVVRHQRTTIISGSVQRHSNYRG